MKTPSRELERNLRSAQGLLLGVTSIFMRVPLETSVWLSPDLLLDTPLAHLTAIPGEAVLAAFIILWLSSVWLLGHWISRQLGGRPGAPLKQGFRLAIGGLPLCSLPVTLQVWKESGAEKPPVRADLILPPGRSLPGSAPSLSKGLGRRLGSSYAAFGWLTMGGAVFLGLLASWFAVPREEPIFGQFWGIWTLLIAAHGLSFSAMQSWSRLFPFRAWAARWKGAIPFLSLLPLPLAVTFILLTTRFRLNPGELGWKQVLVRDAFEKKSLMTGSRGWFGQDDLLSKHRMARSWVWAWLRAAAMTTREARERFLSLCRLKCLVVALDGLLLGRLAAAYVQVQPEMEGAFDRALAWYFGAAVTLLGALILGSLAISLGLRVEQSGGLLWLRMGFFAWLSHVSLWSGIMTGSSVEQGILDEIGWLLFKVGFNALWIGTIWSGAHIFLHKVWPNKARPADTLLWTALLLAMGLLGLGLVLEPASGGRFTGLVERLGEISPVLNLLLAGLFARDLLHPFSWRQAVRLRPRWRVAFLLSTLAAPLGGLAIPVWIFARHRWWPGWQASWSPEGSGGSA